jgi:hypothetical protein
MNAYWDVNNDFLYTYLYFFQSLFISLVFEKVLGQNVYVKIS